MGSSRASSSSLRMISSICFDVYRGSISIFSFFGFLPWLLSSSCYFLIDLLEMDKNYFSFLIITPSCFFFNLVLGYKWEFMILFATCNCSNLSSFPIIWSSKWCLAKKSFQIIPLFLAWYPTSILINPQW